MTRVVPLVFLAFWLLLMVGGRSRLLRDPGTFWHTSVGEKILRDGFFAGDPFTFSHAGQRWVPHQWLGEVGMALVHRAAGFDGYVLLAAAVLATIFTWLTVRLLRTGAHPILAVPVACLAMAAASGHFHVRPLLLTIAGVGAVAAVLTDIDAGRSPVRHVWWLVPLFLVWTNVHGGMLGGLITLALVGGGWVLARAVGIASPLTDCQAFGTFTAAVLACGLTAFANPYGWEIPRAWLVIMTGPKIPEVIEEHRPLDPLDPSNGAVLALAAVYLLVLLGADRRAFRVSWLVPLFWLAQAFLRVRHAPLFAVVAVIAVADVWPHTRWAKRLLARPDLYDPARGRFRLSAAAWLVPVAVVGAVFAVQAAGLRVPVVGAGWARIDPGRWPVELLDTLREYEPSPGEPNHLFNECEFGGYAIYHVPGYKVFVDDRAELYGDAWLDAFVASQADVPAAVTRWQAEYGRFDFALTRVGTNFDEYFRSAAGWECVRRTATAAFYHRVS
jgi:hypothetical protein